MLFRHIEEIAARYRQPSELPLARVIGSSREGAPIEAWQLGTGPRHVSLIGGCHADEPVGPMMLGRLVGLLSSLPPSDPLLAEISWWIVPHTNPDGAARNSAWSRRVVPTIDHKGREDRAFELAAYARNVVRELPGDDVEFGFPRGPDDLEARPENQAVASFLFQGAPFHLHGSFHGMSFAPGPWFLIEPGWVNRSEDMRSILRQEVRQMRYALLDLDRKGEKGFRRIDEGFSTRPDSKAMAAFFEQRGDPETARKFRPSSMELVRSFGGNPLTFVSEMPLFLLPEPDPSKPGEPSFRAGTKARLEFHSWLNELAASREPDDVQAEALALRIRAMPIRDQMRLQLAFLARALDLVQQTAL